MADIFVSKDKEKIEKKDIGSIKETPHLKKSDSGYQIPGIKKANGHFYGPLSSFCHFPLGVKFISKDSKEEIVLFLRRHWTTNIGWILISVILLFSPVVLDSFPILSFLPGGFQFIAVAIWYMVVVAYVLESFLGWFFNVCIITDERVFDVDFVNLIYREITDANLDQIQDVTVRMGGAIRTIFNFGDVIIQTAGEVPRIEFTAVPNPDKVAKILRELRVEEETEKMEGRVR